MHLALRAALETAQTDGTRAGLADGRGAGICAGQDLGDRDPSKMTGPPDLGHTVRTFYAPLVRLIRASPFPVVCAVNGVAAGAGANLALACDIVLAAESAKFIQSFSKVRADPGHWRQLAPAASGGRSAGQGAGPDSRAAARRQGRRLGADLESPARQRSDGRGTHPDRPLCAGADPRAGLSKQAIQSAATNSLTDHLDLEAEMMKTCGESADYAEGVSAFLHKRTPRFSGPLE